MIDIGSCFSYGVDRIKSNPGFYILATVILSVIAAILVAIAVFINLGIVMVLTKIGLPGFLIMLLNHFTIMILIVLLTLPMVPLVIGFWKGIKKEYEGGKAEIADLFSAFDLFVPGLLNYGVASVIVAIGSAMCYLPGIIVFPLIPLSLYFLVRGDTKGFNALKKSIDLLIKNPILILFCFIFHIVGMLGLIICLVGVFATSPLSMCATYKLFQQAIGEDKQAVPANPVQA